MSSQQEVELLGLIKIRDRLLKEFGKCETEDDRQRLMAERVEIHHAIDEIENDGIKLRKLIAGDITPAELGYVIAENDGRMAIYTDEGGEVFALMDRFADKSPQIESYLKCFNGSHLAIDRAHKDRPPVNVRKPALTIVSALQPSVMDRIAENTHFQGRGLFERFAWAIPKNTVGDREIYNVPPVPIEVQSYYTMLIYRLVQLNAESDEPLQLYLSPEAQALWFAFSSELEPKLGSGAELDPIGGWAGKLAGMTARFAGLIHCTEHQNPSQVLVSPATMQSGIEIGRFFLEHAHVAFGALRGGHRDPVILKVWRCIVRHEFAEFTENELWNLVKEGHAKDMETLKAALKGLEEHGYLRRIAPADTTLRRGRKTSQRWQVRPEALERGVW